MSDPMKQLLDLAVMLHSADVIVCSSDQDREAVQGYADAIDKLKQSWAYNEAVTPEIHGHIDDCLMRGLEVTGLMKCGAVTLYRGVLQ